MGPRHAVSRWRAGMGCGAVLAIAEPAPELLVVERGDREVGLPDAFLIGPGVVDLQGHVGVETHQPSRTCVPHAAEEQ